MFRLCFNPRPPRGGRQTLTKQSDTELSFNPRPPRGGRLKVLVLVLRLLMFQSTPPTRGTTSDASSRLHLSMFQSTPPTRGTTFLRLGRLLINVVSIHAPHEGDDTMRRGLMCGCTSFNPRPPRGGRPSFNDSTNAYNLFQSTPPTRGTTAEQTNKIASAQVSIHAPHEGDDTRTLSSRVYSACFNPRPPRGGRQVPRILPMLCYMFQSTPPTRGTTRSRGRAGCR